MTKCDRQFSDLLLQELDLLYRLALQLTRCAASADDLVQETAMRAWRARGSFELRACGVRPWLVRILRNTRHAHVQQSRRREAVSIRDRLPPQAWLPETAELNAERLDDNVKRALDRLPENYRVVLLLWAVEGLTYKEIADAIDVPLGTVMSRLYRARAHLVATLPPGCGVLASGTRSGRRVGATGVGSGEPSGAGIRDRAESSYAVRPHAAAITADFSSLARFNSHFARQ